ncbi:class I SAM-dependent methyltransferase [Vibrio sp. JC009]|uniref:class I SAM-dependent methyltransferase n=1 Tax=Vibrio sp. JC009 TaxID=2912314 RepID=UPI0023AF4B0E|nr:class I SAM-dependent methyltransferase [Vibrio sp. JC009]WED23901.1 class I SAM-dependent methyltransferase [Vibrio sp. JC009]
MNNKLDSYGLDDKVAQTLLIPLYMKSREAQNPDAIIHDPIACKLMEELGCDFSFFNKAVKSCIGCALRARYFDDKVIHFVTKHPNSVVVNIGCGLDARYERVRDSICSDAVFYHLDLPEVIEFREQLIPKTEQDTSIKASLFETEWMDSLAKKHQGAAFLFLVEGVFMYFDNQQVKDVFNLLAERFENSEIIFDATSKWMSDNSHRHDTVRYTGARFKLALDDSREVESWHSKLRVLSTTYYSDFDEWKRAGAVNYYMMKLLPKFRKASYLVHCAVS